MQRFAPSNKSENPGLSRNEIIAKIKDAGFTLKKLAQTNGFTASAISVCLSTPWPAVEKIIGDAIGISPHKIWPPRYAGKGVPIKRGRAKESRGTKSGAVPRTGPSTNRSSCKAARSVA